MAASENSMADLIRGAIQDLRDLIRDEVRLARSEMRDEMARIRAGATAVIATAVAALLAAVFLLATIAWALVDAFEWPVWAGLGVVTAGVIVIAAVLGMVARSRLSGHRHMVRTVETLKEDVQWMRARTHS